MLNEGRTDQHETKPNLPIPSPNAPKHTRKTHRQKRTVIVEPRKVTSQVMKSAAAW